MTPSQLSGARLFSESARRVVDHLSRHTPMSDWSVSRVVGGEQVHVHVEGNEVVEQGTRVPWEETFCRRMSLGAARIVPDSTRDPDYSDLDAAQAVRAYAGFPLTDDAGDLFGVLCGLGAQPLPHAEAIDADLVSLLGDLLSAQLVSCRELDRERHESLLARAEAHSDALTDLLNRRGWDLVVAEAQERLDAYGDAVSVMMIDLDGLKEVNDREGHLSGDALLVRAAEALRGVAGVDDHVARYGGDEFAVLSDGITGDAAEGHLACFLEALAAAGVAASGGVATAPATPGGLGEALRAADLAMYARKRGRQRA